MVADPSNAVVPGAEAKATNNATGIEYSAVTTSDGKFAFQDLPLGDYKIVVTLASAMSLLPQARFTRFRATST